MKDEKQKFSELIAHNGIQYERREIHKGDRFFAFFDPVRISSMMPFLPQVAILCYSHAVRLYDL